MGFDPSRFKVSNYDVLWGSYPIGGVDKVTPDLKLVTKIIKIGTLGDVPIGERSIGLDGTIKVEAREVDLVQLKGVIPWSPAAGSATPGTAAVSIPLISGVFHQDLYDLAKMLVVHPTHMLADTSQDLTLLKATPIIVYHGERNGVADDMDLIEFRVYPLRTGSNSLASSPPMLNYGYIGPPPP